jgi:death-on-curing protein
VNDAIALAAAYTFGIVRNHPFTDGNKRTGFVVGILFLEINGYRLGTTEENAAQAVLSLAAATLTEEEDAYANFLRDNSAPVE